MNLLGVDVGTTSMKAAVYDENLNRKYFTYVEYTLETSGSIVEYDVEEYYNAFLEIFNRASAEINIDAIAIDTQCETLILTDEQKRPLRKAIVWLDNRADAEAKEIEAAFGRKRVYEVTGQPDICATWPACKLLWVKRNEPGVWKQLRNIFILGDYLIFRLTHEFAGEMTLQSSSLYFDITKRDWWDEMLDYIGIDRSMLPTLYRSGTVVGDFRGIPVVTGAIDQIAGAIGAGVVGEGVASEMTGTIMAVFMPTAEIPPYDPASMIPCHLNYDGNYCLLPWTSVAGMALKWFKNALCEEYDYAALDVLASAVPPGSDGLIMLPHLCGSTMPRYNPDARGCFYGMTLEHTRGHFVRSILEAVACMLRASLEYSGASFDRIISSGGGSSSPLWCQIKADMTGKKIVTLKNSETATLGSAILAGLGIGLFKDIKIAREHAEVSKIYLPGDNDYSETYLKYTKLDKLLNG